MGMIAEEPERAKRNFLLYTVSWLLISIMLLGEKHDLAAELMCIAFGVQLFALLVRY